MQSVETEINLSDALSRALSEATISLRDAGVIIGRSYNFMLRLVLDNEEEFSTSTKSSNAIEIFPGVCVYRLGNQPGSHYVVPSAPLLNALGLEHPFSRLDSRATS